MTTVIVGLAIAALVLVGIELWQRRASLIAWAVLLLAIAELLARLM
jgi:hypothetical protein